MPQGCGRGVNMQFLNANPREQVSQPNRRRVLSGVIQSQSSCEGRSTRATCWYHDVMGKMLSTTDILNMRVRSIVTN